MRIRKINFILVRFVQDYGVLSSKNYLYSIRELEFYDDTIRLGQRYKIVNKKGFDYNDGAVEIVGVIYSDISKNDISKIIDGKKIVELKGLRRIQYANLIIGEHREKYSELFPEIDGIITTVSVHELIKDNTKTMRINIGNILKKIGIFGHHDEIKEIALDYEEERGNGLKYLVPLANSFIDRLMTLKSSQKEEVEEMGPKENDYVLELKTLKVKDIIEAEKSAFKIEEREEKNMLDKILKGVEIGKYEGKELAYSVKGIAVATDKSYTKYVTYNAKDDEVIDVSNFEIGLDCFYKMPVSLKDIKVGDIIKNGEGFVFVKEVGPKILTCVDYKTNQETKVYPIKNLFGFNYYTKVVNFLDGAVGKTSDDSPFGNILPLMLMGDSNMGDNSDMLMMMALGGNSMFGGTGDMNKMLPLLMLGGKNGKNDNALMMMLMMNGNLFADNDNDNKEEEKVEGES